MKFHTVVACDMPGVSIHPGHRITLLGSCFADNVGRRMAVSGLDVHVNPYDVHVLGAGGEVPGWLFL